MTDSLVPIAAEVATLARRGQASAPSGFTAPRASPETPSRPNCRAVDAGARIRHAARDTGCDRRVGELDLLRAVDPALVDAMRGKQLVEQQDVWLDEVVERGDALGIAARDHEPGRPTAAKPGRARRALFRDR